MSRNKATAIGFTAVLMWALLALLTIGSAPVPPFLLNAVCFAIGGAIGLVWTARQGFHVLREISWKVYAFGTIGLFGYHFLYFTAFRTAPTAETGLIAYLWPLLIVLTSALLPGEKLRPQQLLGAAVAFSGAALIILARDESGGFNTTAMMLAFGCALTWTAYSVLSRRLGEVPTESVTVFCLASAALSLIAHLALEETIWPATTEGWLSMLALGLGPVGAAFFTWDIGMKRGDIQLLGVASYAAPLLSTLALILAGKAEAGWTLLLAAVLITGGAALAARKSG
ncbi:aromatic amino acid exporter YddG [Pseudogemmobacter humi]|uniref:Aromatic amino acid exporter YddG n=1 Tax=Pseudogemmobacter humi TaxID=2483812 RepID=A0A3P5X5X7_9RHOB|nr:EamA family transporter [Pseudogemmobacter humi]VDC23677.1 Aromatic amino acid exporter YddG [Pseudogemmobacter humi]